MNKIKILVIFVLIAGLSYFYITKNNFSKPTPTKTSEYISKGFATKVDFPKVSFVYPEGWTVSEDASQGGKNGIYDNISVTKGQYTLLIEQALFTGGSICNFKDENPPKSDIHDLSKVKFYDLDTNFGHVKYFTTPYEEDKTKNIYIVCQKSGEEYIFPKIGYISMTLPLNYNKIDAQELFDIIKSIKASE